MWGKWLARGAPFFMVLSLATAAPAEDQSGMDLIELGRMEYQKGDFEKAHDLLARALPRLEHSEDQATAHLLLGMIRLRQGDSDGAGEEFGQAVLLDPQRSLPEKDYPPDVVRHYDQARARNLGSVIVQTDPSDAEVYIDGRLRGLTPAPIDNVPVGPHVIKLIKDGYRAEEREITVLESERSEFYIELNIIDEAPPLIEHEPVKTAREGASFRVRAHASDNIGVAAAQLHFRKAGLAEYETVDMYQVEKGVYEGVAPHEKIFKPPNMMKHMSKLDKSGKGRTRWAVPTCIFGIIP